MFIGIYLSSFQCKTFLFVKNIILEHIAPNIGALSGGTIIQIKAQNFTNCNNQIHAVFNNTYNVPGILTNETTATFVTPGLLLIFI